MSRTVRFLPEAEDELRAAADWYDDHAELGEDLATEVRATTARIADAPTFYPCARAVRESVGVREAPVKRFPYRVIFVVLEQEIRIVAIAHARRRPGYWRDRLQER